MKQLLIRLIRYYQAHASQELRGSCLFTPSCSEYMILAVEKYGSLRGAWKGIGRILRCHAPNGGEDYP